MKKRPGKCPHIIPNLTCPVCLKRIPERRTS